MYIPIYEELESASKQKISLLCLEMFLYWTIKRGIKKNYLSEDLKNFWSEPEEARMSTHDFINFYSIHII